MIWCPCRVVKLATSAVGFMLDTALQLATYKMPALAGDVLREDD